MCDALRLLSLRAVADAALSAGIAPAPAQPQPQGGRWSTFFRLQGMLLSLQALFLVGSTGVSSVRQCVT